MFRISGVVGKMEDLLNNAIKSIELGVEDYKKEDPKRVLSAIRNMHSGVVLLCKKVLWDISPNQIYRDGDTRSSELTIAHVEIDMRRPTIGVKVIEDRLKKAGVNIDWDNMHRLTRIRNKVEHLFMDEGSKIAVEALASVVPIVDELLTSHLNRDPAKEFGVGVWETILRNKDVFEKRKKICLESFRKISNWPPNFIDKCISEMECPKCQSKLILQSDKTNVHYERIALSCMQCRVDSRKSDILELAISNVFFEEWHFVYKDGDEEPVEECQRCHRESWIVRRNHCALCHPDEYVCDCCGEISNLDNFDVNQNLCKYCLE